MSATESILTGKASRVQRVAGRGEGRKKGEGERGGLGEATTMGDKVGGVSSGRVSEVCKEKEKKKGEIVPVLG